MPAQARAYARGGLGDGLARPEPLQPEGGASVADSGQEIADRYAAEIYRATGRPAIVILPDIVACLYHVGRSGSGLYSYEAVAEACREVADSFAESHKRQAERWENTPFGYRP